MNLRSIHKLDWWVAILAMILLLPGTLSAEAEKESTKESEDHSGGDKDSKGKSSHEDDGVRKPLPWEVPRLGEQGCDDEEILVLRNLRLRGRELDRRETAIEEQELALHRFEKETSARLDQLQQVRADILALLEEQQQALERRVVGLAKMVGAMKAKDAAEMMVGVEEEIALQILQRIKAKQAGKILGAMPAREAQRLAEGMTEIPEDLLSAAKDAAKQPEGGGQQ